MTGYKKSADGGLFLNPCFLNPYYLSIDARVLRGDAEEMRVGVLCIVMSLLCFPFPFSLFAVMCFLSYSLYWMIGL